MTTRSAGPDLTIAASTTSAAVTKRSHATVRPLGTEHVQIEAGYWADRQWINREETLLAGHRQLERTGSLDNLRIAAGRLAGTFRGLVFVDSDVYKWLEAVSWELARGPAPELARLADEAIDVIAAAQQEDGYLNSYYQIAAPDRRFTDPQMGHELYCAGHLIQAAVAHARVTGSTALLHVAVRFADCLDDMFGPGRRPYLDGHPEIEMALVELYRLTGRERYLTLAGHFIDQRGYGLVGPVSFGSAYYQDHRPVRAASTVTGHAVRALYLCAGVTDTYLEAGDETLLAAQVRQWDDMVSKKLYLTGGVGSRHRDEAFGDPYELPPDRAYCETCAAIASVMWSWRLLLATGEARYADLIERTLYNGFAAGLSLDGRSYYYTNPLHVRSGHETQSGQGSSTAARREPWYTCACCPPNIMRLISSLGHYVATTDDDGVQIHQYVAGTVRTRGTDGPAATLRIRTDYPWSGSVQIEVEETADEEWALSLRTPAWSHHTKISVEGSDAAAEHDQRGYLRIRRRWRPGDQVSLELDLAARLTAAHPRVDAVRGCVAIERGPLVYALEQVDLPSGVVLDDICLTAAPQLRVVHRPDLLGGVTTVTAKAAVRRAGSRPLYSSLDGGAGADAAPDDDLEITAVPYYAWANREADAMRVWLPRA